MRRERKCILVTEKLFGQSMLYDSAKSVVLSGEIALMSDGRGRSEIHIRNQETGLMERLVFTTGTLWIPVMQLIQAIRDTHDVIDNQLAIVDGNAGTCADCGGVRQVTDAEGNWRACPRCMGTQ